jgi:hypothetical protein
LPEYLFRWGAIHDAGVKRLFGVVDRGRRIVDGLVEEALQVGGVAHLKRGLEGLVQNRETTTKGKGEGACENRYTWKAHLQRSHTVCLK